MIGCSCSCTDIDILVLVSTTTVTVLAASAANQYSVEKNGSGVFTRLLIHALDGGAASILGEVTPGNIYGYIDKAMGEKGQRPIFMTSIRRYTNLRKVYTQIRPLHLKEMINLFPNGSVWEDHGCTHRY